MSTCKDCLHYESCKGTYYTAKGNEDILYEFEGEMYAHSGCEHFKNKADYVEVRYGKWEEERWCDNFQHICSLCHKTVRVHPQSVAYSYCPYCGANMKGGKDNA